MEGGGGDERMIRGQQSFAKLIATVTQDAEPRPTTREAWLVFLRLKENF